MNKDVYLEPALLKGETLRKVLFVKELGELGSCWVLQSASPETNWLEEYEKIEREAALEMYPELSELFELKPEKNVFFLKGMNSGKWIDFV